MVFRCESRKLATILCFLCLPAIVGAQAHRPASAAAANRNSERLAQIQDEFWQHALKNHIYQGAISGEELTELPDVSEQKESAEAGFAQHIAEELKAVDARALSHQDWLTLRMLQWEMWRITEEAKYYWLYFQIAPYTSPLPQAQSVLTGYPLRNQADLDQYLVLLTQYADFVQGIDVQVHEQARRGIVLPRAEIPIAQKFLSGNIEDPDNSTLAPETARMSAIPPQQAAEFRKKAVEIVRSKINPALQKLVNYVGGEYAAKAPEAVGIGQYPGGKEFYRYATKLVTTLDVTPEEVHRVGLEEVDRTERQMADVRRAIGFKGTREEFHHYLKTDPRFFPKSPEEIEARLREYLQRVEPLIPKYFSQTPKAPYAIQRLPSALEGGQTFGHYELPTAAEKRGIYYYNGSRLNQRSLLPAGALVLHEIIPGHHFQMNLQEENQHLPPFRRVPLHIAYTEGWANYCSALGREMGVYEDLYDVYGMLMTDMRHSVRLVVDTGMNAMGWSRESAMQYMRDHGVDSEAQIESESLRYSVDLPGQALAYKMGSREIWKLRNRAEKLLGKKFDLRQFHDCLLGSGSMPLGLLEEHMKWCVGHQGATRRP